MFDRDRAIRELVREHPQHLEWFNIYIDEASFALSLLESDLEKLATNARILEVGSGIGLVALELATRGFRVTAVEPAPVEFGAMTAMNQAIRQSWGTKLPEVEWISSTGEDFISEHKGNYDFAYSINVIEHVQSVPQVIWNTVRHLKPEGYFHFVCPNYDFPYEAHFNIPTLISKNMTYKVFEKSISESTLVTAPQEFWDALSWPSPRTLKRESVKGVDYSFSRDATKAYIDRLLTSDEFGDRKGPVFQALKTPIERLGTEWVNLVPVSILPIIDCKVRQRHKLRK